MTDTWNIPSDLTSGVYVAKLVREDGTFGENQIPFVVRDDGSMSDILLKTSDDALDAEVDDVEIAVVSIRVSNARGKSELGDIRKPVF